MENKKARILIIVGVVITLLFSSLIIYGILDYLEVSQYRDTTLDFYRIFMVLLAIIGGIGMTVIGIRKLKGAKQNNSEN